MKISINGKPCEVPGDLTVAQLLEHVRLPQHGVAVAKNDCVVRRSVLDAELVCEGDRIEIINAVAGG